MNRAGQLPLDDPFFEEERGEAFRVADYLAMARRRWKLVAAAVLLGLAVFGIRYSITPKEYRATAQIQIERRGLSALTGSSNSLNPWLENWWNLEYYPTQYRLLQSRGVAEIAVRNLRLAENPLFHPGAVASVRPQDGPATAADDEAVVSGLALKLLGGLEVTPIQGTQLVAVSYRSRYSELTDLIANGVVEAFIDWGVQTRSTTVGEASGFLKDQIEMLKREIQTKDAELQAYGRESDMVTLDPGASVMLKRLEALNADYTTAVGDRIDKEARYNELQQTPREAVADSLSGGLVGQLKSELSELEREYATKLNTFKPEWPAMVELNARVEEARRHLDGVIAEHVDQAIQTARAEYQTARRREEALAAEYQALKDRSLKQSSAAIAYNNLLTEITTRRALLDDLLRRQSETMVASQLPERATNIRWVDRAMRPGGAFRPSLRRELSLGLMMGLVAGIGLVLLVEFLDRTLKTPEEAEQALGLPTLAVIPDASERGRGYGYGYGYGHRPRHRSRRSGTSQGEAAVIELLPHTRPRIATSEAYRSLRTALLMSTARELRAVAVTSAESGEGKTVTTANLAIVMAQLGRRVLIVDCDLRKPRLHEVLKTSNRTGLVNYLTAGASLEQTVAQTEIPGLYLTPAGPTPPNPAELLASGRMRDYLEKVLTKVDFLVIDTPPVLAVTDAIIAGSLADGVLLCIRAGQVPREEAKACRDRLLRSEVKILGTVLNRYAAGEGRYAKRYRYYNDAYGTEAPAASTAKDSAA